MQTTIYASTHGYGGPRVVSARAAELATARMECQYLQRENERLQRELAEERAKLQQLHQKMYGALDKAQLDHSKAQHEHITTLRQQLAAVPRMFDVLISNYSRLLLPPHLPQRKSPREISAIAQSLNGRAPQSMEEYQQRVAYVTEETAKQRHQLVRKAIADELNTKITSHEIGRKRLQELELALVDCRKNVAQLPPPAEIASVSGGEVTEKVEEVKDMIVLLDTEREMLVQGLARSPIPPPGGPQASTVVPIGNNR